jgi:ankyrin repeat protein
MGERRTDGGKSGMSRLFDAVFSSDISQVKAAITLGSNLNEIDSSHMTPLLYAVFRGDLDTARLLLEGGADPNLCPKYAGSPLWHAEDDFGLTEIAELLRTYGARK